MKKLLITGASGLLGTSIVYELQKYFNIFAIYNTNNIVSRFAKYIQLDLTDKDSTFNTISEIKPDYIIHTAANTNVEFCENNPDSARKSNIDVTANIVEICSHLNIKLIHISTDYVFDGSKGDYSELDKHNPIGVYSQTKSEAEKAVKKLESSLIIRTSIYGWNLQNKLSYVEWVISELKEKKKIMALTDQITSMIFVNDLARILKIMIDKELTGIYNVGSNKSLSKYDIAIKTAQLFNLDPSLITQATTDELIEKGIWKTNRPKNTSLNISKIEKLIKMPSFDQSLTHMKKLENIYKNEFTKL